MRAAHHVLDPGAQLLEPQAGGRAPVEARRLRVEVGADELSPQHPLVGDVAGGGCGRPLPERGGNLQPIRGHRAVDGRLGHAGLDHGAPVQLVLHGARDLHALDDLPVAQHRVVGDVAPDVVVVERADPRGQPGGGVERHQELLLLAHPVRDGGMADAPHRDGRRTGHPVGVLRHLQQQERRGAQQLALGGGQPQPRHAVGGRVRLPALLVAPGAVDACHVAGLRGDDLAVGVRPRRRVLELAHPVQAAGARADVGDHLQRGLVGELHLAAGDRGLLGLPVPHGGLLRDGPDGREGLGTALGLEAARHQVLASARHGHRGAGRHDQRDDQGKSNHRCGALHGDPLRRVIVGGTV